MTDESIVDDTDKLTVTEVHNLKKLAAVYSMGNVIAGTLVTLAAVGAALISMYHTFMGPKS